MSRPPIFWSQSHKAQVVSLFMMGVPLSGIIGGPVTELISLISAGAMVLVGRSSDRHVERCWHFIGHGVLAAGGLLALPFGHGSVLLTTLILIVAGVGSRCIFSLCWVLPTAYLQGRGAAGGIALASMVGTMGSGVSPTIIGFMVCRPADCTAGWPPSPASWCSAWRSRCCSCGQCVETSRNRSRGLALTMPNSSSN